MKFLKNKDALTLAELIVAVLISAILFWIVIFFTMTNVNELSNSQIKTSTVPYLFWFQETIQNLVLDWVSEFKIINQSLDWTNPNDILILHNPDKTKAFIFWIVELNSKKIKKDYTYWDNYLWYRELSIKELEEINLNTNLIYEKEFFLDKMFIDFRVMDFNLELFNRGKILELSFNIMKKLDEEFYNKSFSEIFIDDLIIGEYNLVF